jgi:hypothetical protein
VAVDKVMRDPEWVEIPEASEEHAFTRGGLCLVCGDWIEPDARDVFRVVVSNPPREARYPCHEACFERVRHASVPGPA